MATIVYDHNGGGGNLFAGKKFFFTQRVPTRQTLIDLVKVRISFGKPCRDTDSAIGQRRGSREA
jgi:hypothetical protein